MRFEFVVIFLLQISHTLSQFPDSYYEVIPDLFRLDDYDKCLYLTDNDGANYCSLTIQLEPENPKNVTRVWNMIKEISSDHRNYRHDLLRHGVCTSAICANYKGTIKECLNNYYNTKYIDVGIVGKVQDVRCETKISNYKIETTDVLISVLLGVYVAFVLSLSIWLELLRRKLNHDTTNNKHLLPTHKLLSAFSVFDNIRFMVNFKHQDDDYMLFLQSLRFIFSLVVIFGHVKAFDKFTPLLNPDYYEKEVKTWFNLLFSQGKIIVSIFFVISTWLMTIKFFKKLKEEGTVSFGYVIKSIIRRYIRITSGHVIIVALHRTLLVHLFHGPLWESMIGAERKMCKEHWWANLLYVGNFAFSDEICLIHTWSMSVDFQLTVLGLFILWLTQKKPRNVLLASGLVIAGHVVITFAYLFSNNYKFSVIFTPEVTCFLRVIFVKEWQSTWTTTYSNLAALGCGLCIGYLHVKYENEKFIVEKKCAMWWWILTAILIVGTPLLSMCFMTSWYYSNSRFFPAAYGSVDKVFFILGITLLIFGLSQNVGGSRKYLEWAPMHTFGQLSFGAYLIHYSFLEIEAGLRRTLHYMSDYLIIAEFMKNATLAYMSSIFFTAFVLMPMDRLSKMLTEKKIKSE